MMIEPFSYLCLAGYIAVTTIPPGARVEVNGRLVGRTPLVTEVVPGSARVSVVKEWGGSFFRAETTAAVVVADHDTAWLAIAWGAPLYVDSEPQGAAVAVRGKGVGLTPTVLRGLAPGAHRLTVSHPCCPDSVVAVFLSPLRPQHIAVRLRAPPAEVERAGSRSMVPVAGALVSLTSGLAAWALHEKADHAYDDYLGAADPDRIESSYQKARRLDRAAVGFWALSLGSFLSTLLWWAVTG